MKLMKPTIKEIEHWGRENLEVLINQLKIFVQKLPDDYRSIHINEQELSISLGFVEIKPGVVENKRIKSKEVPGWHVNLMECVPSNDSEFDCEFVIEDGYDTSNHREAAIQATLFCLKHILQRL